MPSSMLILCIFGGIVQKIIGVTVVYTENICSRHFLIKIGRHILCMKFYGIRDSELTHYPQPTGNRPFSVTTEVTAAPWNPQHKL